MRLAVTKRTDQQVNLMIDPAGAGAGTAPDGGGQGMPAVAATPSR